MRRWLASGQRRRRIASSSATNCNLDGELEMMGEEKRIMARRPCERRAECLSEMLMKHWQAVVAVVVVLPSEVSRRWAGSSG